MYRSVLTTLLWWCRHWHRKNKDVVLPGDPEQGLPYIINQVLEEDPVSPPSPNTTVQTSVEAMSTPSDLVQKPIVSPSEPVLALPIQRSISIPVEPFPIPTVHSTSSTASSSPPIRASTTAPEPSEMSRNSVPDPNLEPPPPSATTKILAAIPIPPEVTPVPTPLRTPTPQPKPTMQPEEPMSSLLEAPSTQEPIFTSREQTPSPNEKAPTPGLQTLPVETDGAPKSMRRSASPPTQEPVPEREPATPLSEPSSQVEIEPTSHKPKLIIRIKSAFRDNLGVTDVEEETTAPPRPVPQSPPTRAPTAPVPSKANEF